MPVRSRRRGGVNTPHTHRATKGHQDRCWTGCVTLQDAHGNIIRSEACSCGATRHSEINGGRTSYGPWKTAGEED